MIRMSTFKAIFKGKEEEFEVITPGVRENREAQKEYNAAFNDAVKSKAIPRAVLDEYLEREGLWNEDKKKKIQEIQKCILADELKLSKGGISKSEAKKIALNMRKNRKELQSLYSVRSQLDSNTAEGIAENARFNSLLALCLVYKSNRKRVFNSTDDFLDNLHEEVTNKATQEMVKNITEINLDYEKDLPENKFLVKYGFADDKLRLVKDGKYVDEDGRRIDEAGRYIDENGEYVDINGNRVDVAGNYVVEFKEFLDD